MRIDSFAVKLTIRSLAILSLLLITIPSPKAQAQGTAFTYQGHLNNNGLPASGSYDLRFTLFATNVTGAALAGPVTNQAVGVTNSLFTTTVDFGSAFTGASNWLELAVSTTGDNAFTTLAPRQQLTPVPYAIFASTAGNLSGSLPTAQLTGTIPATNIVGTLAQTQLPGGLVSSLPFIILHTNSTASVWLSGSTNPTTLAFPSSTTAGFNEVQAMFHATTNDTAVGFKVLLDAGLFKFTSQLVISNSCIIEGCGAAASVFEYVGPTNDYTLYNLTNDPGGNQPYRCEIKSALMYILTNGVPIPGDERHVTFNVKLRDFSLKITTNMYCVGVMLTCGDWTEARDLAVGGPQLWSAGDYSSGWVGPSFIPVPSAMIAYVLGDNQTLVDHCSAVATAVGISIEGNDFATINNFNAICTGNDANSDEATAFPANCDYSMGAGILIPRRTSATGVVVNNYLSYETERPFFFGNNIPVNINYWNDQYSLNNPACSTNALNVTYAGNSPPATDVYGQDGSGNLLNATNNVPFYAWNYVNGGVAFYNGYESLFSATPTSIQWSEPIDCDVTLLGNHRFAGNGSGLTGLNVSNFASGNVSASNTWVGAFTGNGAGLSRLNAAALAGTVPTASLPGITTNVSASGITFYITNGLIMRVSSP